MVYIPPFSFKILVNREEKGVKVVYEVGDWVDIKRIDYRKGRKMHANIWENGKQIHKELHFINPRRLWRVKEEELRKEWKKEVEKVINQLKKGETTSFNS